MGETDHWEGSAEEIGSRFVALLLALSLFSGMLLMLEIGALWGIREFWSVNTVFFVN